MAGNDFQLALDNAINNAVSRQIGIDRVYQGSYNPKRRKYNCLTKNGTIKAVRYKSGRDITNSYLERKN